MKQKRLPRYPWNRWLKRKRFRLVRGKDFACMPHSMAVQVRNAAAKQSIRVSVTIDENILSITTLGIV